jgi:hypothetical protein
MFFKNHVSTGTSVGGWHPQINFSTKFFGSLSVRFCIWLTKVWNRQLLAGPPAEKAPISGLGNSWRRTTIFPQPTGCGSRPALPVPEFYWALLTVHSLDQKKLKSVGSFRYLLTIGANKKVIKLFILMSALKSVLTCHGKTFLRYKINCALSVCDKKFCFFLLKD